MASQSKCDEPIKARSKTGIKREGEIRESVAGREKVKPVTGASAGKHVTGAGKAREK